VFVCRAVFLLILPLSRCAQGVTLAANQRNKSKAMTTKMPEVVETDKSRIACDGGGEHPRVWLQISHATGSVQCPYCDCKYVLKQGATAH
jgi:uncharacterized Zn-finger protein